MKADWKQWCLAVMGIAAILIGAGAVIYHGLAWYWPVGGFVVVFICLNYVGNKQTEQRLEAYFSERPVLNAEEFGKYYFPPEHTEIAIRLRKILANHVGIDISRMNPTDRFIEDLLMDDFDSMSTVEFVIKTEMEFGIKIPDSVAEKMTTFQSVVDYIAEVIKTKAN